MELMKEEAELLPKLRALVEVYEQAMLMAEAQDHHSDLKALERRQGYLLAFLGTIRPPAQDTTQPLF